MTSQQRTMPLTNCAIRQREILYLEIVYRMTCITHNNNVVNQIDMFFGIVARTHKRITLMVCQDFKPSLSFSKDSLGCGIV